MEQSSEMSLVRYLERVFSIVINKSKKCKGSARNYSLLRGSGCNQKILKHLDDQEVRRHALTPAVQSFMFEQGIQQRTGKLIKQFGESLTTRFTG